MSYRFLGIGLGVVDLAILLVISAGLMKAALAVVCLGYMPELLWTRNSAGIPRWIPHLIAFSLAGASVASWRPRIDAGLMSAWWALGAAAFSRPALVACGIHFLWTEVLFLPVVVGLCVLAANPSTPSRSRLVLVLAVLAPVAVSAALMAPSGSDVAHVADSLLYTFILAISGLASWVSRRHWRTA